MKFLRATKDYQIKLLAMLPRGFSDFVSEHPESSTKIHLLKTSVEGPLFSAAAPQQTIISNQQYSQLLDTRLFSEDAPDISVDSRDEIETAFSNGYFANFEVELQVNPIKTLPYEHYEEYLAPEERMLLGNGTTHGRIFFENGGMLSLNDSPSLTRKVAEFLFGRDSDPLAERPELLREMLKTRNRFFESSRPAKRKMKDSNEFPAFSTFEKSVVQELHVVREPRPLEEEEVISVNSNVALTDKAIYLLTNGAVKDQIPLSLLCGRMPDFAFLTHKEASNLGKPGAEPYGSKYYLLAHDCVMTTGSCCALLCSMFESESDKCKLIVLEILQQKPNTRQIQLIVHSECESQKLQMTQVSHAESEQLKAVNSFYTNFPLSLEQMLFLSQTQHRPRLLFSSSLSGLLYACYDDAISQYSHISGSQACVSINDGDFAAVLQRLEHLSELDRKRYCADISYSFWRLIGEMYEKYRYLVLNGINKRASRQIAESERSGGHKLPGLIGELGNRLSRQISSINFQLRNASAISFTDFRKAAKLPKMASSVALASQAPERSVRFSMIESLASSVSVEQEAAPCCTAFCLIPPEKADTNHILKSVLPSQICCLLNRGDRVLLVCAGFNGASRLRVETALTGNAQMHILNTINNIQGNKVENIETLLELNFENYIRNQILLPMDIRQVTSGHVKGLCEAMMVQSVIDMRRDRRWIFQEQRGKDERGLFLTQYQRGNEEKEQRFVLLAHFLSELGLLEDTELKNAALETVRTAYDACSGVSALLQLFSENPESYELAALETTLGERFALLAERDMQSHEFTRMASQKLEKLSDFEAVLSNCCAQTGDHKILFSVLCDHFCATGDELCAQALAEYLYNIVNERIESAEELFIENIHDFPGWLNPCLDKISEMLQKTTGLQLTDASIFLSDAYLFFLCANDEEHFAERREQTLSTLDNLKLNNDETISLARVCCRYHDFHRFSSLISRRLSDLTFDELFNSHLYAKSSADIVEMLEELEEGTTESNCQLESCINGESNVLPSHVVDSILACYRDEHIFELLDPVNQVFTNILHEFEAKELNARALGLRVMLGQQVEGSAEMEELRGILTTVE